MFENIQNRLKKAGRLLPVALLPFVAHAQFNYAPANAVNAAGTYTDLGTTGTAITTASNDDANSAAQPIGFTFNYNGTAFTQFVLNTNGFIKLGATAPSAAALFLPESSTATQIDPIESTNAADINIVAPFNFDLTAGSAAGGTEYRVTTTGTSPNQVCTIQWKNVADKTLLYDQQYSSISFQVKLYEANGNIEFVYNTATQGTLPDDYRFAVVGLKGLSAASGQTVMVNKGGTGSTAWSTATFITGFYTSATGAFNYRGTVRPDAGRTFRFVPTVLLGNDVAVNAIQTLTKLPIPQGTPHVVRTIVTNNGSTAQTNLAVTLTATGANAFTDTQTIASLASGASVTVSFAGYTPTAGGNSTLTVTVPADGDNTNNSKSTVQLANASTFSYNDASAPTSARGFAASTTATNAFLTSYTVGASTNVTQVRAYLVDFVGTGAGSTIGKTVYAVVLNPTTGAVLGRSADFVVTAASLNTYTDFTLNTPVTVASGSFLAGLAQTYQAGQTTQYFPLGTQPETPGRTSTFYTGSITTPATPTDVGVTIAARFMVEAVTAPATAPTCAPVTGLTAGSITQTGATLTFTAPTGASNYVITYSANGGAVTTVTPAPSASPVVLTGLTAATTYTVSVATSCGAGQTSPPTIVSFTTALPTPAFAALPYSEGFEGPWVSLAAVRDVPTATNNWRNTPATGNNSWRREDDGATAGWSSNSGAYTPASSVGSHSARFHTYDVTASGVGTLDLYVNLSATASKTLQFDYLNTTGTDVLDILVSTDGGATFATTPAASFTTSTTWGAKTVSLTSTSATTVIRFRATSDYGLTDLGIDNVRVSVISAVRNEALAATVNLYPNPAHQSFKLDVPAGSLHNASAKLVNALGQVVLTRQLNLPAAGGSADFNVSNLAAGVYSLTLKSGNDLVVKRVVVE